MSKPANHCHHAIIVLGMHRSGTSALTGVLNRVGVNLGDNLLAPQADSPAGYWENLDVYNANEKLLQDLNSSWDDVRSLPDRWWDFDVAQIYKLEIISIIERDFANSPFWGIKDPRICRLLPLWRPMLEQTGNKPYFLIIVRNPLEVVTSLSRRDGFLKGKSCLLWLKHLMDAEKETRNTNRIFVTYEELLSDWKGLLTQVEKTFGFKWPVDLKKAALQVEAFLTNSLRHNIISDDTLVEDETLSKWISDSYLAVKDAVDGDDRLLINTMNTIEAELREADKLYTPVLTDFRDKYLVENVELQKKDLEIERLNRRLEESHGVRGHQLSEIEHLQTSITERDDRIQGLDAEVAGLRGGITERDTHIHNIESVIKDKDTHIHNIESELNLILTDFRDKYLVENVELQKKDLEIERLNRRLEESHGVRGHQLSEIEHLQTSITERDDRIQGLDAEVAGLRGGITERDTHIHNIESVIKDKDTHIHNIESELNLIKQSKVWRISEFFRRFFYIKLLGKFPLLQKGMLTITREGFRAFQIKIKRKLRDVYRAIKGKLIKGQKLISCDKQIEPYEAYVKNNEIQLHIRKPLFNASTQFQYRPLISIIMPVYNVEPRWLKAAVDSVIDQIYTNWELCIADDASTNKKTHEFLKSYENHEKIKVVFRAENGHICAASNSAADQAKGEFVAFMDNDDVLAPNALFEIVRILQNYPNTDLIYSDEDKIDENDRRYDPQFKPDWSPELFLSYNYVNHFTCIRRKFFESVGQFQRGYEGAQDYDLILRVIEKTNKIRHIPKVLYHWRAIKGSVAFDARDKPIMHTSAQKGLKDHLNRKGIEATIYQPEFAKSMGFPISQLDWPDDGPSVAIIIPTKNQYRLLKKCIESIIQLTTYTNYEIVIVDNDSDDRDTLNYLKNLLDKGIRVERIGNEGRPFSFSRINNLAVQRVNTEYILFLNNDIEVLEPKWLSRLAGYLNILGVGVTGAKLFYPNQTIQHAGVVLGMHDGIIPDHAFLNHHKSTISYYFMAEVARNCSAVTGACLMTRRFDFLKSGGFNERDLKVSLQDVDYCLRLAKEGLSTVYVADAEMIHHHSMSRQLEDDPRELAWLRKTYVANSDPYYNPNLSKINSFALDTGCGLVDYSEFLKTPLKVVIFSHNLELAGAPKAMYDLAIGLKTQSEGKIVTKVVSPVRGPFQSLYDCEGIECQVIDQDTQNIAAGWVSRLDYDSTIEKVQEFLQAENPDIVISNTVYGFYAVHAAQRQGVPAIWIISESFDHLELKRSINDFALEDCIRSFAQAYRVVFGSVETRNCYESYNSKNNFQVIHNSVDQPAIDRFINDVSKEKARQRLGVPANKKVLLMVGTICERKGQETVAEAAAILQAKRNDFCCYLVGANEHIASTYLQKIHKIVNENNMSDIFRIVPETEELYWYYRAGDIFVFSSHMECYPLATLEAMAFGLPIVTTPCCGVTEQVRSVNALFFNASDSGVLANQLSCLLNDGTKVKYFGGNSRAIFEYQQTIKEMIEKYKRLVFGAWIRGGIGIKNKSERVRFRN